MSFRLLLWIVTLTFPCSRLKMFGFQYKTAIRGDGNCQFRAIAGTSTALPLSLSRYISGHVWDTDMSSWLIAVIRPIVGRSGATRGGPVRGSCVAARERVVPDRRDDPPLGLSGPVHVRRLEPVLPHDGAGASHRNEQLHTHHSFLYALSRRRDLSSQDGTWGDHFTLISVRASSAVLNVISTFLRTRYTMFCCLLTL